MNINSRTHTCGELRISDVNKEVKLIGWVAKKRNLGSLLFIDLRDREGYTQILVNDDEELFKLKVLFLKKMFQTKN